MRKILKAIISITLAALMLCTASAGAFAAQTTENATGQTAAAAGDTELAFHSIDEVDAAIQTIYHDNADTLYQMAQSLATLSVKPEYFTYYCGSCGPMSKSFQKVLADNGILVEVRKQNVNTEMHAYNLMRVSFDGGQTITNIIIDPTYKQTMRYYFQQQCGSSVDDDIDQAIAASGLPDVLVFEYGDTAALDAKLNGYLSAKGLPHFDVSETTNYYEPTAYPEYEIQGTYDTFLTDQQIDEIHHSGKLNKPFDTDLYLTSADGTQRYPMTYEDNGIYSCMISQSDFPQSQQNTFTIRDDSGNVLYGAGNMTDITGYYSYNYSYMSRKTEAFLSADAKDPFNIICSNQDMMVHIDMRARLDAPLIVLMPLTKHLHGALDYDNVIDSNDVFILKAADFVPLTAYQRYSADFFGNHTITKKNVTALREYIAHSRNLKGNVGQPFYEFSISNGFFVPLYFEAT